MRIYLDMCCYNRPYDDQSQLKVALETQAKLEIQRLIREGELELVTSYILRYECSNNPFLQRRETIFSFIDSFSTKYVNEKHRPLIKAKIKEVMATGVKLEDASHVASAIFTKCDYFISTDKRLLNYETDEIRMINPIKFITELEDE